MKLYVNIALFSANLYSLRAKRRGHDYTFLGFRYSVIAAAYGCLLVCSGTLEGGVYDMRVPNWCWFLFYFYRKMPLLPSTLKLAIAAWHCLVINAGTLLNCSLAWLSNKSHLNGWMISTMRQHLEGILVLSHGGSGQEGRWTREKMHWHCTY